MDEYALGAGMIVVILIGFLIGLAVAVFYLLTLQKCLNRVSPANRAMNPALVWLNLIPFFSLVWNFIVVLNISKSLLAEGAARGINFEDGGKTLGLVMAILMVCSIIPLLGMFSAVGGIVCWILYWVKISGYSNQLALPTPVPAPIVAP